MHSAGIGRALLRRGPVGQRSLTTLEMVLPAACAALGGAVASAAASFLSQRQGSAAAAETSREEKRRSDELLSSNLSELRALVDGRLRGLERQMEGMKELSTTVIDLQRSLSDKQLRGAFGESQLEILVRDALPASHYDFQHTLSNGRRVDCLVQLPAPPGAICVDSKFPLESWREFVAAPDSEGQRGALKKLRSDVERHIGDISSKYIIAGETAETAVMFVPSEAVYAGIHAHLPEAVEASRRQRVLLAGPNSLMLLLHTVCSILRDVRMQEAARNMQVEVGKLVLDVQRLDTRVAKLASHFDMVNKDIQGITISCGKIVRTGQRVAEVDFDGDHEEPLSPPSALSGGAR